MKVQGPKRRDDSWRKISFLKALPPLSGLQRECSGAWVDLLCLLQPTSEGDGIIEAYVLL